MVVGCQPYAPAAFTPRNIPGTHFHYGLSRPQEGNKSLKNPVTTLGIDPGTVRLVAQRLNHYATPAPALGSRQTYFMCSTESEFLVVLSPPWRIALISLKHLTGKVLTVCGEESIGFLDVVDSVL